MNRISLKGKRKENKRYKVLMIYILNIYSNDFIWDDKKVFRKIQVQLGLRIETFSFSEL